MRGTIGEMFAFFSIGFSFLLSIQALFTLFWMLYYWEEPENAKKFASPEIYNPPKFSFTALIPARHEDKVIADTIRCVAAINYPEELKEILVLCRIDDQITFSAASECIRDLDRTNIHLVTYIEGQVNKPYALNIGLSQAKNEYICIFDAEDDPHRDIYQIINTVIVKNGSDIVQSGVQLMNFSSQWFSVFNVMEYFFWFKSGLPFFHYTGRIIPLGGNTVFFRKDLLKELGGWDNSCLTEDADIGIRAKAIKAKINLVYDERHVTREETPDSTWSLINQRTRWNQGFLQIFFKGDWLTLPGLRSKITAVYLFFSPFVALVTFLYLPIGLLIAIFVKLPLPITLFSFLPFYIFAAQLLVGLFGLFQFSRLFHQKIPLIYYLRLIFLYIPFQSVIAFASARSIFKFIKGNKVWEKTLHTNIHRQVSLDL